MTNDDLKAAAERLVALGFKPETIKRAQRKVKPSRPRRVNGNWALKHEKHGPCKTLSAEEIRELGYPVSEEITNA